MRKLILLFIFLTGLIIQLPTAEAWTVNTHYQIIDQVYYSLPADAQHNLNLSEMRQGSVAPDLKFFDFSYHKYPAGYAKALYWLDKGKREYKAGDYGSASYSFGVASHYISDFCSAPHCLGKSGAYHTLYEVQSALLKPQITEANGNLLTSIENGKTQGQYSWNSWIMNRDDSYIQKDLNNAASASYIAINQYLN
jgi:hypothetical protein